MKDEERHTTFKPIIRKWLSGKGYALGHFGDNSSHIDFDSIHPSPGKKSER